MNLQSQKPNHATCHQLKKTVNCIDHLNPRVSNYLKSEKGKQDKESKYVVKVALGDKKDLLNSEKILNKFKNDYEAF